MRTYVCLPRCGFRRGWHSPGPWHLVPEALDTFSGPMIVPGAKGSKDIASMIPAERIAVPEMSLKALGRWEMCVGVQKGREHVGSRERLGGQKGRNM